MVKLESVQQEDFDVFLECAIREYADDHVRNGNWTAKGSLERSKKEFEHYLPNDIRTQEQYLYSTVDESGNKIGVSWVQVREGKGFILDFIIDEIFRSKGYGKETLMALDEKLKSMNVDSVGLHVFGDNFVTQGLYKKAGFQITGIHMRKY